MMMGFLKRSIIVFIFLIKYINSAYSSCQRKISLIDLRHCLVYTGPLWKEFICFNYIYILTVCKIVPSNWTKLMINVSRKKRDNMFLLIITFLKNQIKSKGEWSRAKNTAVKHKSKKNNTLYFIFFSKNLPEIIRVVVRISHFGDSIHNTPSHWNNLLLVINKKSCLYLFNKITKSQNLVVTFLLSQPTQRSKGYYFNFVFFSHHFD